MSKVSTLWPEVNFPFTLAPMVGLTHAALREVIRDYLPKNAKTFWPTEMLNSRRLPHQNVGETPETKIGPREDFLVPQILGNEKKFINLSIQKLTKLNIKGIDINMGCPVRKALRHNYGVALMGDPNYASQIVAMAKQDNSLPVSVKIRAGLNNDNDYLFRFCDGLIAAGANLISLHPRTAAQKRRGNANWDQITQLKKKMSIPLYGNGDVQTYKDALKMLDETGCDGVMIGRALTVRPWMFWQLGEALGFDPPAGKEHLHAPQTPEEEAKEYGKVIESFIDKCFHFFDQDYATRKFKFYLKVSSPWLNFGQSLIKKINKGQSKEHYSEITQEFFHSSGLLLHPYTMLTY